MARSQIPKGFLRLVVTQRGYPIPTLQCTVRFSQSPSLQTTALEALRGVSTLTQVRSLAVARRVGQYDTSRKSTMRINFMSVLVDNQAKTREFYTQKLGFVKKTEFSVGEDLRPTVVSPSDPEGSELLLEPDRHPAAKAFKKALVKDAILAASFAVNDVAAEHTRLVAKGVHFTQPPSDVGTVVVAVFDDTCENLIQIAAEKTHR